MTTETAPMVEWEERSPGLSADETDRIDAAYVRDVGAIVERHRAQLRGELPVPDVSDDELAEYRAREGRAS